MFSYIFAFLERMEASSQWLDLYDTRSGLAQGWCNDGVGGNLIREIGGRTGKGRGRGRCQGGRQNQLHVTFPHNDFMRFVIQG